MKINRNQSETTIEHSWGGFGEARCIIYANGGDNRDAGFYLEIKDGGQIEKNCEFKVDGPIERDYLKTLLKQIILEIDLIDNHRGY